MHWISHERRIQSTTRYNRKSAISCRHRTFLPAGYRDRAASMAQHPDLQSILATLAQFSQPSPSTLQQANSQPYFENAFDGFPSTIQGDNATATEQNASLKVEAPTDPRLRGRPQSRAVTPVPTPQPKNVIDPATITTWQEGLRCVTKIAAQNKMFEASIKRVSAVPLHV